MEAALRPVSSSEGEADDGETEVAEDSVENVPTLLYFFFICIVR